MFDHGKDTDPGFLRMVETIARFGHPFVLSAAAFSFTDTWSSCCVGGDHPCR